MLEKKLYCNTGNCIAVRHQGWAGSVLQYTGLYCREEGCGIVLQDGCSWLRTVLQYSLLYCRRRLGRLELYRNTLRCIATVEERQGWTVLRYSAQPSHDTARRRAAGARLGAGGRWAQVGAGAQAAWALGRRPRSRSGTGAQAQATGSKRAGHGRLGGLGAAWVRCWPTGCALDALSLFLARFDSVLFLSQFLDIVREPGL